MGSAATDESAVPSADAVVAEYALWIKRTALRISATMPWADVEELIQWGTVGLLEARERFDPSRGKPFSAFASRRIHGAMIDSLRREGNQARRIGKASETITENTLGHSSVYDDPLRILLDHADMDRITEAVTVLSERQQLILQLFYVEGHNNREIARGLEVSEAYVSKTRRRAVERVAELVSRDDQTAGDEK